MSSLSATKFWSDITEDHNITSNVFYLDIANNVLRDIQIIENNDIIVDLVELSHEKIRPMHSFDDCYKNTYEGYGKLRHSVYLLLLEMLKLLPDNIGIAYFECWRPLWKQKEYFDNKMIEIMTEMQLLSAPTGKKQLTRQDVCDAYLQTTKDISPFIDNTPPHATGAAVDITLFDVSSNTLLDLGKFDVIFGPNDQQDTFASNITTSRRDLRIMLLRAAVGAGFVNYGFEWWHYSYGDKVWAHIKGASDASTSGKLNAIYDVYCDPIYPQDRDILLYNKDDYIDLMISTINNRP